MTALVCGQVPKAGALRDILTHLADTLDRLLVRSAELKKSNDKIDIALLGPFLARATMEVSVRERSMRIIASGERPRH